MKTVKGYEDSKCCVRAGRQEIQLFNKWLGLRQGCIMSPGLCNMYIDIVLKDLIGKGMEVGGALRISGRSVSGEN